MDEELKFQKLSEVELVEEASENAHPLIEEDGKIKRAKGGISGGIPTFDLTPYIAEDFSNVVMSEELPVVTITPVFTDQEAENFINLARSAGAICLHLDASDFFGFPESGVLNQIYSVQYTNTTVGAESPKGVILLTGMTEILLSASGSTELISAVGWFAGSLVARIHFPFGLSLLMG